MDASITSGKAEREQKEPSKYRLVISTAVRIIFYPRQLIIHYHFFHFLVQLDLLSLDDIHTMEVYILILITLQ